MSSFEAKLICISPLRHTFESISHWQTLEPRETTPVGFAVVVGDNVEGDDVGDSAVVVDETPLKEPANSPIIVNSSTN